MFTICVQPPTGECSPADVSVEWAWATFHTPEPDCYATVFTDLTWTNPCGETYSVSYVYTVYYIISGTPTLEYTSGTFTNTIPPGVTAWAEDTFGPVPVSLSGPGQDGYVVITVTYPDTSVRSYTSFTDTIDYCT